MLKIVEKLRQLISYELWIQFINSINGRLLFKLVTLKILVCKQFIYEVLVMLGILFGYLGGLVNNNAMSMNDSIDYSQKLTATALNKVNGYYSQLIMLAYLSEMQSNSKLQPLTISNLTQSNDSFTEKYKLQHGLNSNNISLYRSVYRVFDDMTQQGWVTTQKLAQIDSYILEFMFNYDNLQLFFHQYYLINLNDKIMHYFPVIKPINESYINQKQTQQILYSNETIMFTYPTTYGLVLGVAETAKIENILKLLESSFFIKIFKPDNSFSVSNGVEISQDCECQANSIVNVSNDCQVEKSENNYYSSPSCNSLYVKDISTDPTIKIYLVIYKQLLNDSFSISDLYSMAWPYYLITLLMLFINVLILINRINLFTRDITNPIKQVTYKIDKIINNIFQLRIINKIQADDILIKEETEVQTLIHEFSRLFEQLRNTNTFNIQTLEKKEKKDIQAKQSDKSIEQIKILGNKFRESL